MSLDFLAYRCGNMADAGVMSDRASNARHIRCDMVTQSALEIGALVCSSNVTGRGGTRSKQCQP